MGRKGEALRPVADHGGQCGGVGVCRDPSLEEETTLDPRDGLPSRFFQTKCKPVREELGTVYIVGTSVSKSPKEGNNVRKKESLAWEDLWGSLA